VHSFVAKVRMYSGNDEYVALDAADTRDARFAVAQTYRRRGAVVAVVPVVSTLACPNQRYPARSPLDARKHALERIAARHTAVIAVIARVDELRRAYSKRSGDGALGTEAIKEQPRVQYRQMTGRKCPDCGAPAMHRVDGCERCEACAYVGSCG